MTRSPVRRALSFLAFTTSVPMLVMGCPKKQAEVVDAEPPPPATTPTVTELAPLTDDGGPDADAAEAGPKKWSGGGYNSNQMKIKECCNAMRAQAKAMGTGSPEAFQVNAMAAQCDVLVTQVGSQGNAPEFAQLRAILKSIKLPEACKF